MRVCVRSSVHSLGPSLTLIAHAITAGVMLKRSAAEAFSCDLCRQSLRFRKHLVTHEKSVSQITRQFASAEAAQPLGSISNAPESGRADSSLVFSGPQNVPRAGLRADRTTRLQNALNDAENCPPVNQEHGPSASPDVQPLEPSPDTVRLSMAGLAIAGRLGSNMEKNTSPRQYPTGLFLLQSNMIKASVCMATQ